MPDAAPVGMFGSSSSAIGTTNKNSEVAPAQILEHRENVFSDDPAKQLHSTQHFRRLLSIGECCALTLLIVLTFVVHREESSYPAGD